MPPADIAKAILSTIEQAEERNHSIIESYSDTLARIGGLGVIENNPNMRSFIIYLAANRDPMRSFADEKIKSNIKQKIYSNEIRISSFEEPVELTQSGKNALINMVDEIRYENYVRPRARGYIDIHSLFDDVDDFVPNDPEQGNDLANILTELLIDELHILEEEIKQELQSTFTTVEEVLSNEPSEEDWQKAFKSIAELTAYFDQGVRYWSDLR